MRALWIINGPIPSATQALGIPTTGFLTWVESGHRAIRARGDVEVSVAFPWPGEPRTASFQGTRFITFPPVEFARDANGARAIELALRRLVPDIVHIFRTEGGHAYAAAVACKRLGIPFVVGQQGMYSAIAHHYMSGLPARVAYGFTPRDILRVDTIAMQAAEFRRRGRAEPGILELTRYVIGRTTWDRALAEQINPHLRYFTIPETLRPTFYANEWSFETCQPYTIFMSQGHYPLKGLHFVLRALPTILDRHPETELFVSGWPPRSSGWWGQAKQTQYAAYVHRLIRKSGLQDKVHFVGVLDEAGMADRYLGSHVFVSASTVENESNSLSEAKLLGLPVVASYVGGVVDRIEHGATGFLYQHDAHYMLAHYVSRLFREPDLGRRVGARARAESLALNDPEENAKLLRDAYAEILRSDP